MAILVVAAESFELQPFAASLENLRKLKWPLDYAFEGVRAGTRMILVANGAGPKLAAKAVDIAFRAVTVSGLSASKIDAVFSVGLCGALVANLEVNGIVVGSQVVDPVQGQTFSCAEVVSTLPFARGLIISQDRIANTAEEKQRLGIHSAVAVEMEAAGVAAKAEKAGLPFACIKVVSDNAAESFPFDLNEMRTIEGRIARGKIGLYVLTHPTLLPKLLELKRRSGCAARTLGDFLVSCKISSEAGETFDSGEPIDGGSVAGGSADG
jgi:nucleoside phosphorylase